MKVVLLAALAVSTVLAACSGGTPDVELGEAEVDLGEVRNGEIQTFDVVVHNVGSGQLVVESVTSSCGCTSASVDPDVIAAGDSGLLSIRFDSGAHGPDEVGPVMRQVFLATNDPDEPEIEFRFTAEILPPA